MPTSYPGALDTLPRPLPSSPRDVAPYKASVVIDNISDAVEAIEAKLGTGASVAAVNQVLRGTGAGATAFGAIQTADLAAGAVTQRSQSAAFTGTRSVAGFADVDSTNGKITLTTTGGDLLVFFVGNTSNTLASAVQQVGVRLDSDGADRAIHPAYSFPGAANFPMPFTNAWLYTSVPAGSRVVTARHNNLTPTGTLTTTGWLIVIELKK